MQKISAKGRITLPAAQMEAVGLKPGDEVETFVVDDQVSIIKKIPGAAKGMLRNVKAKLPIDDNQSLNSELS